MLVCTSAPESSTATAAAVVCSSPGATRQWHPLQRVFDCCTFVCPVQVFCVTGSAPQEEMRQACFDYLALGGSCATGPVSLLSGLNPSPSLLVMHFFSVALFGVQRLLKPRPTFRWASQAVTQQGCLMMSSRNRIFR